MSDVETVADPAAGELASWLHDKEDGRLEWADLPRLATIDAARLAQRARLSLLVLLERAKGMVEAAQQPVLAAVADPAQCPLLPAWVRAGLASTDEGWAAEEVAAALTLSPRAAAQRISWAERLSGPAAPMLAALAAGRTGWAQAREAAERTAVLDDPVTEAVCRQLAEHRWLDQWTPAQFRHQLNRAILAAAPGAADAAHERERRRRGLTRFPTADGMAYLSAYLPAAQAAAVWEELTAAAHAEKATLRAEAGAAGRPYDGPGVDALRADLLVSWILTRRQGASPAPCPSPSPGDAVPETRPDAGPRVQVQLLIDLPTLLGLANNPAELGGHGPIPPGLARLLAADGTRRRLVTDPLTGSLLDLGRTCYAPSRALREFIRTRDRCCVFPGCRQPAHRCDTDHRQAWEKGGCTDACNLIPLCRRHHRLKTHSRWKVHRDRIGVVTWTSPVGRRYTSLPHDFRPDPPLDPEAGEQSEQESERREQACWAAKNNRAPEPAGPEVEPSTDDPPF